MTGAYRWTPDPPPPKHDHAWTRVYREGAAEAHIDELIYAAHPDAPESWDYIDTWYGTGSQAEYDQARRLPLCPHCFVILEQYKPQDEGKIP